MGELILHVIPPFLRVADHECAAIAHDELRDARGRRKRAGYPFGAAGRAPCRG